MSSGALAASQNVKALGVRLTGAGGANKFLRTGLQQTGYQVGDFAVQVGNGTSAMTAFGQQAPQLLQIFGPIGSIVGAGVAIFAALAVAITKSGDKAKGLSNILGELKAPLADVAKSFKGIKEFAKTAIEVVLNSLDLAIIAVGLFASKLLVTKVFVSAYSIIVATAGKAGGFFAIQTAIAARSLTLMDKAVYSSSVAMRVLGVSIARVQVILMRFLPLAVIVGLALLIEKFLQLRRNVGGFGKAVKLIGELFGAAFAHMRSKILIFSMSMDIVALQMLTSFNDAFEGLVVGANKAVNKISEVLNIAREGLGLSPIKLLPEVKDTTAADEFARQIKAIKEAMATETAKLPALGAVWKAFWASVNGNGINVNLPSFGKLTKAQKEAAKSLLETINDQIAALKDANRQIELMNTGMDAGLAEKTAEWERVISATGASATVAATKLAGLTGRFIELEQASAGMKLFEIEASQAKELESLNRQIELMKAGVDSGLVAQIAALEAVIKASGLSSEVAASRLAVLTDGYAKVADKAAEAAAAMKLAAAPGLARQEFTDAEAAREEATDAAVKEMGLLMGGMGPDAAATLGALQARWAAVGLSVEDVTANTEKFIKSTEKLSQAKSQVEMFKAVADTFNNSFATAFDSIVTGTKSVKDAFRDMGRDILQTLSRLLMSSAMQSFTKMLSGGQPGGGGGPFGLITGALSSLFEGTSTSTSITKNAKGGVFANDNIIPFANGGIVSRATTFPMNNGIGQMGEAGPEAIIPLSRGSDGKLGVSGGGTTVNQTINVTTGIQQTVRAEIQSLMPQIAAASTKAVLDARRRGGSFAGAFG
tara:strand:- start:5751 stop:8228 length:2478 start_codon:yes stop_codon:yes gene_type:complete